MTITEDIGSSRSSPDSMTHDTCDQNISTETASGNIDDTSIDTSDLQCTTVSHIDGHIVIDYSEEPIQPEQLLQDSKPKTNDVIAFYHGSEKTWVRATLLSNELRGHKNYYNIKYETGKLDGLFLIKGERWTFSYRSDLPTSCLRTSWCIS